MCEVLAKNIDPLSAKLTKWPNTLKQFVGNLPTNCLSVFGHFVGLALKGLNCRIVGARQSLQIFRQNTCCLENNRALSKFLYSILHYLTSIIKLYQNQSIKKNFILTTQATLTKTLNNINWLIYTRRKWQLLLSLTL